MGYDVELVGLTWTLVLRALLGGAGFFPGDLWRRQRGRGDWGAWKVSSEQGLVFVLYYFTLLSYGS